MSHIAPFTRVEIQSVQMVRLAPDRGLRCLDQHCTSFAHSAVHKLGHRPIVVLVCQHEGLLLAS